MTRTFNLIWKTALISLIALFAFLALSLAWNLMLKGIFYVFGLPEDWLQFPIIWIVILAILFIPKRFFKLNFPIVFKRSAVIDAPVEHIWDALELRPRDSYYLHAVNRIEADSEDPRRLTMHMDQDLSQAANEKSIAVDVEVRDSNVHSYLDYTYHHDEQTMDDVRMATRSERYLEQFPDGVRVTIIEHAKGLSLFMALMFLLRNPCKDALKRLKSVCEGTPDTSWAGEMMGKLKVEANGDPKASMDGDIAVIGATAIATWGAVAAAMIWYAVHLSASA